LANADAVPSLSPPLSERRASERVDRWDMGRCCSGFPARQPIFRGCRHLPKTLKLDPGALEWSGVLGTRSGMSWWGYRSHHRGPNQPSPSTPQVMRQRVNFGAERSRTEQPWCALTRASGVSCFDPRARDEPPANVLSMHRFC